MISLRVDGRMRDARFPVRSPARSHSYGAGRWVNAGEKGGLSRALGIIQLPSSPPGIAVLTERLGQESGETETSQPRVSRASQLVSQRELPFKLKRREHRSYDFLNTFSKRPRGYYEFSRLLT